MRRRLPALLAVIAAVPAAAAARADTTAVDAPSAARLTLDGPHLFAGTGAAVAGLGDVNADGRPDVAVGSPFVALPERRNAGTVYVVFGSTATGVLELDAVGTGGFKILGGRNYRAGLGVAAAGDVNRDGRADILLSAPRKNGYKAPGSAFVVYGKADVATIDLTRLSSAEGFEIVGVVGSPNATAEQLAGPGDVDGDGYADVLVTRARGGAVLVYGARRRTGVDLDRLRSRGMPLGGARAGDLRTVARAGDVNGDRRPDLLLGVASVKLPGRRFPVNSAFVVFGRRGREATVDLRRLGRRGFRIGGLVPARIYAPAVAGVGDLNRDRRSDILLVRDPEGVPGRSRAEAAVVFGSRSTRTVDLGRLRSRGFRILGPTASGGSALLGPVAGVGDLDGDRVADLGLGSSVALSGGRHQHSAFVVYGRRAKSAVSLGELGRGGLRLTGPPPVLTCGAGGVGSALAAAGDVDGDGRAEVLLGAPALGDCAGQALIVPGR